MHAVDSWQEALQDHVASTEDITCALGLTCTVPKLNARWLGGVIFFLPAHPLTSPDEAIPGRWWRAKWKARGETYEGARMWCQVPCHGVVVISVPLFFGRNMFPMSFLWTFQLVELKTYSSWCDAYAIIHLSPACSACIHLHVDKWTYYRSMCGWCPAGNFPRSCGCAWGHHVE